MTPPDFIVWVQLLAKAAGSVGLGLLSVADSAGIPTGGGPDVLLILQASVTDSMTSVAILTLIAAVGSTIGCLFLYGVGRRSGRVALRRFSEQRIESIRRRLSLHGPWVILLAVMAPPPYPTKLFILCAGVFGMRPVPLVLSTFIGRTMRYGMGGDDPMSLTGIGRVLGISRDRVRNLQRDALKGLRRLGDAVEDYVAC